ncbi:MAG TPA: ATP-binding protein [Gemmataceae bacterium]|nr:ATP-binding protein [Gemmataceae bacterium]
MTTMKMLFLARMTWPILLLSTLTLAGGVVAAWQFYRSQKDSSLALARNTESMRAAEELVIALRDVRHELHLFLITERRGHLDEVPHLRRKADRWLEETERTAVTAGEQELTRLVRAGYERFFTEFQSLLEDPPDQKHLLARISKLADVILTRDILDPAQDYLDINEEEIRESNRANELVTDRIVLGFVMLGICGPVSGLLAGYGISQAVSRSIVRLSVPIRDAAGKLNEIVGPITLSARWGLDELEGVLHTIAERIGAVIERLQQSEREARRAEHLAAVGQMAAGIAHELRNPLMPIKILVQSAADRRPSPGLDGRDLEVLEQEISRLERSIQMFLDFARPPRIEKRTFEAQDVLTQIVQLLEARADRQGVRIECRLPDEPMRVHADVGQFRQVVLNLLLNALDAVPRGGTIRLELGKENGKWLTLSVADTGVGLPPGLGAQIFEPFVSTKETGLGLGLSICKRIVEAHEGEIEAANRPEGGAVFTVRFPVQK